MPRDGLNSHVAAELRADLKRVKRAVPVDVGRPAATASVAVEGSPAAAALQIQPLTFTGNASGGAWTTVRQCGRDA